MSRNPDGLGRKPHRWLGRCRTYLTVGYEPNGEAIRTYVYGTTQAEGQERLDKLRKQQKAGTNARRGPITVDRYLDDWLKQKALQVKPRTIDIYNAKLSHARPHIGRRKLINLTPKHVQDIMDSKVNSRRTFGEGKQQRTVTLTARAAN